MGFQPILSKKRRKNSPQAAHQRSLRRQLMLESLEARQMMAVGPTLQAIIPNEGPNLFSQQPLTVSPTELKLVFSEGQTLNPNTLSAIQILGAGSDGAFGNADDVLLTPFDPANPGFVGLGDKANEVIVRFPSALPDGLYQITIIAGGPNPLRSNTGDVYNDGVQTTTPFRIELGSRIVGVVPQPISNAGGFLTQSRNQIEVYFDRNDPVDPASASDASFYQLLSTGSTATSADDVLYVPQSVTFDAATGRATLTFDNDLALLPSGPGVYRLRVGDNDAPPHAGNPETPVLITPVVDPGSQYLTAHQLNTLSSSNVVISAAIEAQSYGLNLPGGNNEPGHRNIPAENHLLAGADLVDGISTIYYNFQDVIGVDLQGNTLFNVITETQKERVREVFEFYGHYLGAQFVESADQGWLIAAGDLHAIDPSVNSGPGGVLGVAGGGKVVVDAAENFGNSEFGGLFFQVAMHEIGHLIGIGHSTELPDLTINSGTLPGSFGNTGELVFPGDHDIVHGQHLYRPESKDIDLYQFQLDRAGTLSAEITAERLANSSLLDSVVTLFEESHSLRVPGGALNTPNFLDGATFGVFDGVNPGIGFELNLVGSGPATPGLVEIPYFLGDSAELMAQRIADHINGVRNIPGVAFNAVATVSGDRVKVTNIQGIFASPSRLEYVSNYREIIARNDDYFSEDSFLKMELGPGKYYIGVTSTGNTNYDPTIADSGFGGTTQGAYQLRLNFNPHPTSRMVDLDGTAVDGDSDGRPGGEFNYWFSVATEANTVIVDKTAGFGGDGSIGAPFNNIQQALANVSDGDVLRLVGNAGADGNLATPHDAIPYAIGFDTFGLPLADGAKLEVPHGVTLMIDGGAVFKMSASNIDVGSSAQNIDRSEGALQVLGTPLSQVYFTSRKDEAIGLDFDPQPTVASPGDWGGLVFRNDLDMSFVNHPNPALRRRVLEQDGIFLNYVNHADIRYGGGDVTVDSVQQTFTPIHMTRARPTITNSRIAGSADASMSADPNSFEESHFFSNQPGVAYTTDYDRVGPDIHYNELSALLVGGANQISSVSSAGQIVITTAAPHGLTTGARVRIENVLGNTAANGDYRITVTGVNTFILNGVFSNAPYTPGTGTWRVLTTLDNSINGLFVRIRTQTGSPLDTLDVSARFDDTDIVHVISQALVISSTPGGPIHNPGTGNLDARTDARLAIDPGMIVKMDGSRIETDISSQFIAEGTAQNKVVFTSIKDDRYGRGGTFDTNADETSTVGVLGDWGGLFFNRLSTASLDHVLVTYGGGQSTIEGGQGAFFNAIEIHQADVRIANSQIRENEGIAATGPLAGRNNRGTNEDTTIFIRGAQPILVNNIIRDNVGDAININANSLNYKSVSDIGRSVGSVDVIPLQHGNQGPLVRGNRMRNNEINGMVVRGAVLNTEGVWDDTDIVHVLRDEIEVPNHHTFSGLRLKSNPGESLVVKLEGAAAGFTANGTRLDISDRIGGTLQIVGMPDRPVILTALTDDSAAAGLDIDGAPAGDTNEGNRPIGATSGQANAGAAPPNPVAGVAPLGSKWGTPRFGTGAVVTWSFMPSGVINNDPALVAAEGAWTNTVLSSFMPAGFDQEIRRAFAAWSAVANVTFVEVADSGEPFGSPGAADIRIGGHFIDGLVNVLDLDSAAHSYGPFGNPADPTSGDIHFDSGNQWKIGFGGNANALDIFTVAVHHIGHAIGLDHSIVPGSVMEPTYSETFAGPQADDIAGAVFLYGEPAIGAAGAWRSVRLEKFANDRNVEVVVEAESSTAPIDANNLAANAQYLGELAIGEKHSDENLRLGFEVHGFVSLNNTTDIDVYSFTAQSNTEVWFDIDRTTHSLDTIIELVDANGAVLARSDNSVAEQAAGMLPTIPFVTNLGRTMQRDAFNGDDLYTTNPRDAGMRVLLPGSAGQRSTYFIRVRSRGFTPEPDSRGLTSGGYQLQIRLREADEVPGSTIRNSDIRFAINGIEALGLPAHSPLMGDAQETNAPNDTLLTAQQLGSLLANDRGNLSVGGVLSGQNDVDFFQFTVDYDLIQSLSGIRSWAAMFDIDYADGLGRPDTVISVFDAAGNLLLVGRDSDLADDQPGPTQGADTDDLNRGSFGKLDPFIGSVQLPEQATGAGGPRTYYVAVSSNARLPTVLNGTFTSGAANPLIRLEPVTSVRRVIEDHVGSVGGGTGASAGAAFTGTAPTELNLHANAFQLGDVVMYVNSNLQLFTVDAFTGAGETNVTFQNGANDRLPPTTNNLGYRDIAMRNDGRLFALTIGTNNANSGNYIEINPADGTLLANRGDDGIQTVGVNAQGAFADSNRGIQFEALDFLEPNGPNNRRLFAVGTLPAVGGTVSHARRDNLLYELNPETGAVLPDRVDIAMFPLLPPSEDLPRAQLDVGVNGVKLTVVEGILIDDGDRFTVDEGAGPRTLEMDSGITLMINSPGALIPDGTTFSVSDGGTTVTYMFDKDPTTPAPSGVVVVSINDVMTATDVAGAVASAITAGQITTTPGQPSLPNPHAGNLRATHLAAFGQGTKVHIEDLDTSSVYGASSGSAHIQVAGAAGVQPGNFRIPFTPMDTAAAVAARIEQAIFANNPFTTITAVSMGNMVNLQVSPGAAAPIVTIPATTPFTQEALAGGAGGIITGIAFLESTNSLYAVTNTGTFLRYTMNGQLGSDFGSQATVSPNFSTNLGNIPFTGLTVAPRNIDADRDGNPDYENMFIATAADGRLYALNTLGQLQPIFVDGATSIAMGGPGGSAQGLAFSPIDYNLWHVTNQRQGDDGHDITTSFDNSRFSGTANPRTHIEGGMSFYFGLEDPRVNTTISQQPGAGNFVTNAGLFNTYNAPGGAHGSLTTNSFSLEGYSATDKPTLYFDYFLETQNHNQQVNAAMRDSFRVFVSPDGVNWSQLATNNSTLSAPTTSLNAELSDHLSTSGGTYRGDTAKQRVQELFDNTNGWRQARVDLGDFAGMSNLRLRFDFSTAASMNIGGVAGGSYLSGRAGNELRDGQIFSISNGGNPPIVFEFDSGYTLVTPNSAGSAIGEGETFSIDDGVNPAVVYEFTRDAAVGAGNIPIVISNGDSAADVARKIHATLQANPPGIVTSVQNGNRVNLVGAVTVSLSGGANVTLDGAPGVNLGNVPIVINDGMTVDDVVREMALAIDAAFAAANGNVDDPSIQTTALIDKGAIRLFGHSVANPGPLTTSSILPGDQQGNFNSNERGKNNAFEGAYIDNIIVGFAERGEMVTGHRPSGGPAVPDDSFFNTPVDPTPSGLQNLSGAYQLEIRRGEEYAQVIDTLTGEIFLSRTMDTNERLTDGFTLRLPSGTELRDGQTITVNDGVNVVTFEFDSDLIVTPGRVRIPFTSTNTPAQVAANVATAINNITSGLATLAASYPTSNRVDLTFAAFVDVTFGNVVVTGDLTLEGNDTIAAALPSGLSSATPGSFTAAGFIGDNPNLLLSPTKDVDMVSFQLNAGDTIRIDVDAVEFGSSLDPTLRIFDAAGNEVGFNDDDFSGQHGPSLDSYLEFTALVSGTYYASISGFFNWFYDPNVEGSGFLAPNTTFSSGAYTIEMTIGQQVLSVEKTQSKGDDNQFREQGQIIIQGNEISRFSQNGILIDASLRDQPGNLSHQGAVRNLPQLNNSRLVGGVVVVNNVIHNIGQAGITISGDPNAADANGQPVSPGAVPFARVVNNTIWGGASRPGVGIRVTENASPTLLNNIIADVGTGVTIDASSRAAGTVLSATLYRNAPTTSANTGAINGGLGSFPITVANNEPLFENEIAGVFSLAKGSKAIDSSIDSAQDRPELVTVKNPLGIGLSPIVAPARDLNGVLRQDDPSQAPPLGQGGNPFKDRGALERVNVPRISITGSSIVEGNEGSVGLVFTVTLDQVVNDLVTIEYATSNQSAAGGVDYVNTSGRLTFLPGSHTVQTITVPVVGDRLDENDETFLVTLGNATNALVLVGQASGTIVDDDDAPSVSINSVSVLEGNGGLSTPMVFTLQLSSPSGRQLVVDFATVDGTATGGLDYQSTSGNLTFAAGQTSRTITVNVFGDLIAEGDETFGVALTGGTNVQIPPGMAGLGTIVDDEPKFTISDASIVEGNSGTQDMIFNVTLTPAVGTQVTVNFATANGTASAPTDFVATSGTLTFNANETAKTITVRVIGDTNPEPDESFTVVLSGANGAGINDGNATGTIVSDDAIVVPPPGSQSLIVTGADAGGGPHVRVFDGANLQEKLSIFPYAANFTGGVRVATADMNGDGVDDIITAPGKGGGPHIRMFDGQSGASLFTPLSNFFAFEGNYTGGVFIATGDVDGDGRADLITAMQSNGGIVGEAGGTRVRVFNGVTGGLIRQFSFSTSSQFGNGMRVAAGDLNGDGRDEVIIAAAPGNVSRVQAYDALSGGLVRDFLAYGNFGGGVHVAAGDLNGDGRDEIITGADAGGGPHVQAFDGATGAVIRSFFAYNAGFTGGVRVAATDVNADGHADIVTAPGVTGGPHVRVFNGDTGAPISQFFAYSMSFTGGVFVAGNEIGSGLMASGMASADRGPTITNSDLRPIIDEAITRWAGANINAEQLDRMRNVSVQVSNLPAGYLGLARSGGVFIDDDAAGYGWYVDETPSDDAEFASPSGAAANRMDLLTAVMHELGHAIGLGHDSHRAAELMSDTLLPGLRRTPTDEHIDDVFGNDDAWL